MTNNKIERVDYFAALEDGIMTCLEREQDKAQLKRLEGLLETARALMESEPIELSSPAAPTSADDKSTQIMELTAQVESLKKSLVTTIETRQNAYHSFCGHILYEFIQKHVFTALDSDGWERLHAKERELSREIEDCYDPARLKHLMKTKEFTLAKMEDLLLKYTYWGALRDDFHYPDTLEELRYILADIGKIQVASFSKSHPGDLTI